METFKLGLFDIGLNVEKKLSNHYLVIENKELNKILEIEPNYTRPAIRNLQAVFFFHMDAGRSTARSLLEDLIREDPKDLNALAGLVYVYKKMGRKKDSDYYKQQLELCKDDPLSQAKSILGQAYALTYDLADDHNKSPKVLLKDSWKQLNTKSKHPEQISKANELIVETYKVVKTIPETSHEKKIDAKQMAIEKFEKGIKKFEELKCSAEEILVWKHNLAIARSRLDTWRNRRGDDTSNRFENYKKALEAHLDVIENLSPIENLEEPLKIYVAKSYIYFVQVYTSWKDCMENASIPERIKSQDFDSMREKAISICPNNYIILQIYGRYWSNKHDFLKAIDIYSKSISLIPDPDINWLAYSSRRDAYYFYSLELFEKESDQIKIIKNLQHAYDDGQVCMQSKCTDMCMYRMAQICYKLSIPGKNRFECEKIDFIYEALENIHEALNKRDINKDSNFYTLLGNCYPCIGEYRKGIESLKTALELSKWSENFPDVFKTLCKCFMAFFEREKDTNLLTDFRFMLKEASRRCLDDWITTAMQMMQEKNTEMMISLVQNMIEWDAKDCEELIKKALEYQECKALTEQFQIKLQEEDKQETEVNGPNEIQNSESSSISFQYDFFVSHSEKDKDWVNNMLRPNLEEYDEEIKFKGFIPSRDLIPGEYQFTGFINGFNKCHKLLIVLTPTYLKDNYQKYISDLLLNHSIKMKKTIIPIILKNCSIPDTLKIFTPIYFTNGSDWDRLRMSLTINMDSETGVEESMSALNISESEED